MIITLVTGEKIKVKESFTEFSIDRDLEGYNIFIAILTKQSESGHVIEDGELKINYIESVIRVNVNHIVSYE